ncbi:lysin A, glycosyl hydrolase domain [Gordonia phage ODay]|nr:lysin A, glycosyl hydrolase domain [Gordonia phage ODay]
MTFFGIDVSNHQGNFDFARAKSEGITFATHKITEGDGYRDPFWPRAKAEMQRWFPGRWGGYVFCRTNTDPMAEARLLREHAGSADFPLQVDYEDTTNGGSVADLKRRIEAYRAVGFTQLLPIYVPRWYWQGRMGGASLADLPAPIWNSDYVSGRNTPARLYPGDTYKGWADMGGKSVQILQFSETASVAGQSIDVNAFRGSGDEFNRMFGGTTMSYADDELKKKFPSRSKYRDSDKEIDTLAGFVLNVDARIHEEFVEREALKGVDWAVALVKREAAKNDAGAKAVLAQLESKEK